MADQQAPVFTESGDIHQTAEAFASLLDGDAAPESETEALDVTEQGELDLGDEIEDDEETVTAETEDEDSEVADDAGDDEDEADEVETEEDEAAPPVYKVKVDGEEVDVTLDELLSGYSRTSDYTRKTQQLAEQRKAADSELESARAERAQYAVMLEQMQMQLQQDMQEPNWQELYQSDPNEFVMQRELWRTKQEKMQAIQSEQQRLVQQQQADQQKQLQQILDTEKQAMVAAIPEWADAEVAQRDKTAIKQYAMEKLGMSEAESNAIYDHRVVLALRKAYMYDQLMSKPVQPKKSKSKAIKPGTKGNAPQPKNALTKAKQRLAKSGRVSDAADAFELLL